MITQKEASKILNHAKSHKNINSKFTRENKKFRALKEIKRTPSNSNFSEENDDVLFNISDDSEQEEYRVNSFT